MNFLTGRVLRHSMAFALSALLAGAAVTTVMAEDVIKWMHLENNPSNLKVWQDIAKAYEASHPDVKIQFQFLENEAFKAKLPTLLQSPDAPSMFYSWGGGVMRAQATFLEMLPNAPVTRDQLTMLALGDNVVRDPRAVETFQLPLVPLDEQLRRAA